VVSYRCFHVVVAQAKREDQLLKRRNISIEPEASPLSDSNGKVKMQFISLLVSLIFPQGLSDSNRHPIDVTEILEKISSDDPDVQLIGVQSAR